MKSVNILAVACVLSIIGLVMGAQAIIEHDICDKLVDAGYNRHEMRAFLKLTHTNHSDLYRSVGLQIQYKQFVNGK